MVSRAIPSAVHETESETYNRPGTCVLRAPQRKSANEVRRDLSEVWRLQAPAYICASSPCITSQIASTLLFSQNPHIVTIVHTYHACRL